MYSNHPHWLVLTYLQMSYAQDVTSHQLFFLNFAQVWCGTARPEALRNGTRIQNFNVYFCTQKERSYVLKIINASIQKCLSLRPNWLPLLPLPQGSVSPPPWNFRTRLRVGVGGRGSQFGRLEKKPGTLSTLCL